MWVYGQVESTIGSTIVRVGVSSSKTLIASHQQTKTIRCQESRIGIRIKHALAVYKVVFVPFLNHIHSFA